MAMTRATLLSAAEAWVQDDAAKISHADPGDFGTAIDRAIERYSHDRPRERYATASGDGTTYEFAVPTGWVEDFSTLIRVEYPDPPATGQREPNVIFDATARNSPEAVRVLRNASGVSKIRFMEETPVSGANNIRWVFTALHTVHASDASSTTVRTSDEAALALLVASYACEMVASKYAETKDAAISVDSVDFRSRSREYSDRAAKLMKLYLAHISGAGAGDQNAPPASAILDWDVKLLGGRDRLLRRGKVL